MDAGVQLGDQGSASAEGVPLPDDSLDRYARLVSRVLAVPTSTVTRVEPHRQVYLGAVGVAEHLLETRQTPLSHSFCQYVVQKEEIFVVEDATRDERVWASPAIDELGVVAYAGLPITDHRGTTVGALCAIDNVPRSWTAAELADLADLAAACSAEMAQRSLAAELSGVVDELRRSNVELTSFAAQVSHDLLNPLAALTATLELLATTAHDSPVDVALLDRLVDSARASTGRMSELLTQVLAFAIIGGKLAVETVDVVGLVAAVVEDLQPLPLGTRLVLGPLEPVQADAVQLRIVVQNLLTNAAKHAAGSVVEVTATAEDGTWRLDVVDRGRGVAPDDRVRILEPFVRLDRDVPGVGLGLATCRRIAEAHGGRLELTETPGGGCTASLVLPEPAGWSRLV